jgi:hypothetical protein
VSSAAPSTHHVPTERQCALDHHLISNTCARPDAVGVRRRAVVLIIAGALARAVMLVARLRRVECVVPTRIEARGVGTLISACGHRELCVNLHCASKQ